MGVILGQRHFLDRGAEPGGGAPDGFIGRVGGDDAARGRGIGDRDAAQRIGRSGPGDDAVGRNTFDRGDGVEQLLMFIVRFVAIAFLHQLEGGFGRDGEGTGPAFVGADAHGASDRLGRLLRARARDADGGRAGAQQRRDLCHLTARIAASDQFLFHCRFELRRHDPSSPSMPARGLSACWTNVQIVPAMQISSA